jgi:alpha-N-arabinofuranosidase
MRRPANHVRATYEDYQDYLQRLPELRDKHITINIDEWAMIGGGTPGAGAYKLVPAYAEAFNEMFRHTDIFRAAAYTFATSMLVSTRDQAQLSPVGELFKLYRDRFGTIPLKVSGDRPPPPPRYPVGGEQPKVNAGSDTFPIDVSAAWTEDGKSLAIAVVNPTETQQAARVALQGASVSKHATLFRLAHSDLNYVVVPGLPSKVKVEQKAITNVAAPLALPPYSVSVYVVPKQ